MRANLPAGPFGKTGERHAKGGAPRTRMIAVRSSERIAWTRPAGELNGQAIPLEIGPICFPGQRGGRR